MASLAHPHIVRFVGVSWASLYDLCVLSELMKGGDLRTYCRNSKREAARKALTTTKYASRTTLPKR
ncbi:hypothetical protein JG688_00004475 [Phytophthora aleatoria]|uniref:Serine-threonine/tyrosine-protein kinase catalytic domain-containing protein n=1 Tax=Phytophthora aleatoria TaxID=2496075 RepID=A0A8J5IT07_9STRA|nr:hypothetical protein JG688_00004475 [Phytophthora aleatoria]